MPASPKSPLESLERRMLLSGNDEKIAFVSQRDGNREIYTMNADGTNPVRLTHNPADDYDPVFSPDGSKIAFLSSRDGGQAIYVMNSDGTEPKRLTSITTIPMEALANAHPTFTPDGRKIAYADTYLFSSAIFLMNADGSNQIQLTSALAGDGDCYSPSFSPDGTKIAFLNYPGGSDGTTDIFLMNADGTHSTKLARPRGVEYLTDPTFSPDGRIAFTWGKPIPPFWPPPGGWVDEIWMMHSDGTHRYQIASGYAQPTFSPDGANIAAVVSGVYVMNADGTGVHRIIDDTSASSPSWGIATPFAAITDGVLKVHGTTGADIFGVSASHGKINVTCNGQTLKFPAASVKSIQIFGGDGNDSVTGGAGVQGFYACGDAGDDVLRGVAGNDTLSGGAGRNTLFGSDGNDRLNGSGGRDSLYGDAGNDRLYGNGGNDYLVGGGNVDRIWGGAGDDLLSGGSSNDKLLGGAGLDQLFGGNQDDLLMGGGGADLLNGGKGTDVSDQDLADTRVAIEGFA